eukprot:gene9116-10089_t
MNLPPTDLKLFDWKSRPIHNKDFCPCMRACMLEEFFAGIKSTFKGVFDRNLAEKALSDLNSNTEEDLSRYKHLGKDKADRILAYRRAHGKFNSIDELEKIDGFTTSIIQSFKTEGLIEKKKRSYEHIITVDKASKIKSLTSITIGRADVAWCSLSTNYEVLEWKSLQLQNPKQYRPKLLIQNLKDVLNEIAITDMNIVELQSYKSASKDPSIFPNVLHRRLVEIAFHAMSPVESCSFDPNSVRRHFSLPKSMSKQYYSMTVVNDLLMDIMNRNITEDGNVDDEGKTAFVDALLSEDDPKNNITQLLHVPNKYVEYYHSHRHKDGLSDSLMQALAFLQLEVLDRC